jgi:hypothetical protein
VAQTRQPTGFLVSRKAGSHGMLSMPWAFPCSSIDTPTATRRCRGYQLSVPLKTTSKSRKSRGWDVPYLLRSHGMKKTP